MKKKTVFAYTGERAPKSGQYVPAGGKREITLTKGEITPPNKGGKIQRFRLVDPTKHES